MTNDTFNSNNVNSNDVISNNTSQVTGLSFPADVVIEYRDQELKIDQTCS